MVSKARAAAHKAVELDVDLADGHLALAWIAVDDWDWTTAERSSSRAIELNPGDLRAHRLRSIAYTARERPGDVDKAQADALASGQ